MEMDKSKTLRQIKTQRSNEMKQDSGKSMQWLFCWCFNNEGKNKNITLNNICASVWSQWQCSESKGKVGQLSKQCFFFPKHRWKTDMTFSLRLQCSALCVCFLLCSSEIRRGADEPSEQHRRRGERVSTQSVHTGAGELLSR